MLPCPVVVGLPRSSGRAAAIWPPDEHPYGTAVHSMTAKAITTTYDRVRRRRVSRTILMWHLLAFVSTLWTPLRDPGDVIPTGLAEAIERRHTRPPVTDVPAAEEHHRGPHAVKPTTNHPSPNGGGLGGIRITNAPRENPITPVDQPQPTPRRLKVQAPTDTANTTPAVHITTRGSRLVRERLTPHGPSHTPGTKR